jgi:hypothetical protein
MTTAIRIESVSRLCRPGTVAALVLSLCERVRICVRSAFFAFASLLCWTCFQGALSAFGAAESLDDIDSITAGYLAASGKTATPQCSDAEFLRRATLDVTGHLPLPDDVKAFVASSDPSKRSRKIEELLSSEAYTWKWSNWLTRKTGCDELELKYASGEVRIAQAELANCWLQWIRVRIARDEPYDKIMEGFLGATSREEMSRDQYYQSLKEWKQDSAAGFSDGDFYAARQTNDLYWRRWSMIYVPEFPAEDVAARFLGIRLDCARCHDHPREIWTQENHQNFDAVFQRVRYAELPFTRDEKKGLLMKLAGILVGLPGVLLWIQFMLRRSGWSRLARVMRFLGMITLGIALSQLLSYQHVFGNRLNPEIVSPGLWVTTQIYAVCGPVSMQQLALGFVLIPVVLLILSFLWTELARRKQVPGEGSTGDSPDAARPIHQGWRSTAILMACAVLMGLYSGTAADAMYVGSQGGTSRPEPLAHYCHRAVLRTIGWGGNATQPREVLVSDEWYRSHSDPKLLDGTPVINIKGSDPRSTLIDWIRHGLGADHASRHLVNQMWHEYFGHALNDSFQNLSETVQEYRDELLRTLSRSFVDNNWSIKSLHRAILSSDFYQRSSHSVSGPVSESRSLAEVSEAFPLRRLSAQQWICAVDEVTGTKTDFGESAPPGAGPWQVAILRVYSEPFAVQSFRMLGHMNDSRETGMEAAIFGLVEPLLQEKVNASEGRLSQLLAGDASDQEILEAFFMAAYSREPTAEEAKQSFDYLAKSPTHLAGWQDLVWAILNSSEFQFIH